MASEIHAPPSSSASEPACEVHRERANSEPPPSQVAHASLSSSGASGSTAGLVVGGSSSSASSSSSRPQAPESSITRVLPTAAELAEWRECSKEASELTTFQLGPFGDGIICEITYASFGTEKHKIEVTEKILEMYSPKDGLTLSRFWSRAFNQHFGDPHMFMTKKLVVKYRLRILKATDVSTGRYVESSFERATMYPVWGIKAATNALGATLASVGWAGGKLTTAIGNVVSGGDASVADSDLFQYGFSAWMRLNGVFPTVTYDPPEDKDMKQTPILISNHMCYLDGPVLAAIFGAPKIIAMKGTLKVPLLGQFASEIGVVEVDRGDPDSRAKTVEAIQQHVSEWRRGSRALLLFPEGTTSNGDDLLPFRKGAFVPGCPVRPCVLTYTGSWHPANTTYKTNNQGSIEATGDAEWAGQFFGHLTHSLQVKVLAPYHPSEAEQRDPMLFANNVRHRMCEAYRDLKEVAARPPESGLAARSLQGLVDIAQDGMSKVGDGVSQTFRVVAGTPDEDEAEERAALGMPPVPRGGMFSLNCAQDRKRQAAVKAAKSAGAPPTRQERQEIQMEG